MTTVNRVLAVLERHQRHIEASPGAGKECQDYALATIGDIRNDVQALASAEQPSAPIPMVLHCPHCHIQHIDAPEPETGWTNPPHKSHQCHGCGAIWRPASVPTTGVSSIPAGKHDRPPEQPSKGDVGRDELKPCPFCGGTPEIIGPLEEHEDGYAVQCKQCLASSRLHFPCGDDPKPHVASAWNKRATTPPQEAVAGGLMTVKQADAILSPYLCNLKGNLPGEVKIAITTLQDALQQRGEICWVILDKDESLPLEARFMGAERCKHDAHAKINELLGAGLDDYKYAVVRPAYLAPPTNDEAVRLLEWATTEGHHIVTHDTSSYEGEADFEYQVVRDDGLKVFGSGDTMLQALRSAFLTTHKQEGK